jgi:hypothetical protein
MSPAEKTWTLQALDFSSNGLLDNMTQLKFLYMGTSLAFLFYLENRRDRAKKKAVVIPEIKKPDGDPKECKDEKYAREYAPPKVLWGVTLGKEANQCRNRSDSSECLHTEFDEQFIEMHCYALVLLPDSKDVYPLRFSSCYVVL